MGLYPDKGSPFLTQGPFISPVAWASSTPQYLVMFSADGVVLPTGMSLNSVRCISGTGVGLVLYDNSFSATGTAVYTNASMNAGDGNAFADGYELTDGLYADITGAGEFEINVSDPI